MTEREKLIVKLDNARNELLTAGYIHARDLKKHIRRMERALMEYDQNRYEAKKVLKK